MLVRLKKDGLDTPHPWTKVSVKVGKTNWAGRIIEVEPLNPDECEPVCRAHNYLVTDVAMLSEYLNPEGYLLVVCQHQLQPDEKFDEAQGDESAPVETFQSWQEELERRAELITVSA